MTTNMFHKYPSIENTFSEDFIQKIRLHGYDKVAYCVTEKIHGSNTQIVYNGLTDEFSFAKRTAVLEPGEKCYNAEIILHNISNAVYDLYTYLKPTLSKQLETVKVYGEIFGGFYPHPGVPKVKGATKVQKGVYYNNHNDWLAFDISYTVVGDERDFFLSAEDFFLACQAVGIGTVPLLTTVGCLDDALAYPNDGQSVVYKMYSLPALEDNVMEGVVIKPWKQDLWMGQSRVVLKNKSEKYKERTYEKKVDLTKNYSENLKKALEEGLSYVTEARVNNIISHEGEVTIEDMNRIIGLAAKDAVEDFRKYSKVLSLLEKTEEKIVTKHIALHMGRLVSKIMLGR